VRILACVCVCVCARGQAHKIMRVQTHYTTVTSLLLAVATWQAGPERYKL
jgi:hypothetical protein